MLKFKNIIKNYDDFKKKIIDEIVDNIGMVEWLSNKDKRFFTNKALYFYLKNQFNNRYLRFDEEEFIGYFNNIFIQYTPMFYARVSAIIEDKISELQTNENVGANTKIKSKSKKGESTTPFNLELNSSNNAQDNISESDYDMDTLTTNRVENAKRLSSAKISGEVEKWVNCFAELFTQIDISGSIEKSFTTRLTDFMFSLADIVSVIEKKYLKDADLGFYEGGIFPDDYTVKKSISVTYEKLLNLYIKFSDIVGSVVEDPNNELDLENDGSIIKHLLVLYGDIKFITQKLNENNTKFTDIYTIIAQIQRLISNLEITTQQLDNKLSALELKVDGMKFYLGEYGSLQLLQTAHPTPKLGSYALVGSSLGTQAREIFIAVEDNVIIIPAPPTKPIKWVKSYIPNSITIPKSWMLYTLANFQQKINEDIPHTFKVKANINNTIYTFTGISVKDGNGKAKGLVLLGNGDTALLQVLNVGTQFSYYLVKNNSQGSFTVQDCFIWE